MKKSANIWQWLLLAPAILALFVLRTHTSDHLFGEMLHIDPAIYKPALIGLVILGGLWAVYISWLDPKVMSDGSVGNYGPARLTGMTLALACVVPLILLFVGFGMLPQSIQDFARGHALNLSLGVLALSGLIWLVDTMRYRSPAFFAVRGAIIAATVGVSVYMDVMQDRQAPPGWGFPTGVLLYVWVAIVSVIFTLFLTPAAKPARSA